MSKDDSPFSIFNSPSKKSTHKKSPISDITTSSSDSAIERGKSAIDKNRETRRRVEEMRDRMTSLESAVDEKIELLSRNKGLSKEQIWQFLCDATNFSKEEWELVEQENKLLAEKVWSIVNVDDVGASSTSSPKKDTGSRKGKFVGARRNWILTR